LKQIGLLLVQVSVICGLCKYKSLQRQQCNWFKIVLREQKYIHTEIFASIVGKETKNQILTNMSTEKKSFAIHLTRKKSSNISGDPTSK
jgi:hypothetical protein